MPRIVAAMEHASLDAVAVIRKRPGMYVGDVHDGSGVHHMVWTLIANALDQVLARRCTRIDVILHADDSISIRDDGPGISVSPDERGASWIERVLTTLHRTPTADGHAPHLHLAPAPIGLCAVVALSSTCEVEVRREAQTWRIELAQGRVTTPLTRVGPADTTGTTLRFKPDPSIFTRIDLDLERIASRVRELAALVPGLETTFACEQKRFPADRGLLDLLRHGIRPPPEHDHPILGEAHHGDTTARVAFEWSSHGEPTIQAYCNLEPTPQGAHIEGYRQGLAKALRRRDHRRVFEKLSRGLHAVIAVDIVDPEYAGPTREKLNSKTAREAVREATATALAAALASDPAIERVVAARRK
jgi:DNA gyrase subunit B